MTVRKSWKVLREELVYDNKWISVHDYDVIAPTGNTGVYGKVHMKGQAIGVLPIDENGWTWLVGQQRFCFDEWTWELPEGGGLKTEAALITAKRELAEEISMSAENYHPLFENIQFSNSITDEIGHAFVAWGLSPCDGEPDETELLEIRHLPLKEVFLMLDQGKLTDMFTLAMLSRAHYLAHTGGLPEEIAKVFRDIRG